MFLTLKYTPLVSSKKPRPKVAASPFATALAGDLAGLAPASPSLAWLALAVDLLSTTLADATSLIATPSSSDLPTLASHLDASLALLDACNLITSLLDGLSRRRLILLIDPESTPPEPRLKTLRPDLISKLRPDPPRGKVTPVQAAIYAVEAVSGLVAGTALVVLGAADKADLAGIEAGGVFPWVEKFNEVAAGVRGSIAVGASSEMVVVERVWGAGSETEKANAMGDLTAGLERLSNAVNGLFREALCTRNMALQCFRISPEKLKKKGDIFLGGLLKI